MYCTVGGPKRKMKDGSSASGKAEVRIASPFGVVVRQVVVLTAIHGGGIRRGWKDKRSQVRFECTVQS